MELHVISDLILPALQGAINHDINNAKFVSHVPHKMLANGIHIKPTIICFPL